MKTGQRYEIKYKIQSDVLKHSLIQNTQSALPSLFLAATFCTRCRRAKREWTISKYSELQQSNHEEIVVVLTVFVSLRERMEFINVLVLKKTTFKNQFNTCNMSNLSRNDTKIQSTGLKWYFYSLWFVRTKKNLSLLWNSHRFPLPQASHDYRVTVSTWKEWCICLLSVWKC